MKWFCLFAEGPLQLGRSLRLKGGWAVRWAGSVTTGDCPQVLRRGRLPVKVPGGAFGWKCITSLFHSVCRQEHVTASYLGSPPGRTSCWAHASHEPSLCHGPLFGSSFDQHRVQLLGYEGRYNEEGLVLPLRSQDAPSPRFVWYEVPLLVPHLPDRTFHR